MVGSHTRKVFLETPHAGPNSHKHIRSSKKDYTSHYERLIYPTKKMLNDVIGIT